MPQPTPAHPSRPTPASLLLAVTADTLVAADFRPRVRHRPPGPYRRLLSTPGAQAFTIGNLAARLPMGMFSVSAVVMIAGTRGSYALAGAVTATGLAATALVAPWTARLVDRYGQARVAVPATLFAALGSVALLLCVRHGAPAWTLFAAYTATATTPNTGGMARARWAHLLEGDADALHTANSFEQATDELCYMFGPVLAAFLCTALFPEAGTLVGVVLLVTGMLLFTAQRATEPPARPRPTAKAPFRAPGIPSLLVVCLAMGGVFGAMEVVTIAFADAQGHRAAAGLVLALQAAGSCAAGLLYGAIRPAGPPEHRLPWCVAAMTALLTLPLLAASLGGSLPLLALTLLIGGMATAPTMVTTMTLVQHRTPEGRLNEGMTLAVTGLLGGIACGSAAGGWTVEHVSPTAAYGIPATAAATALLLTLLPARRTR
ncbi:MFS transporter [Streptomyces lividans]|uniref:Transmembrane efflux protein n=2 Tax=Streptomyces lividans TaxID=1916 RepID=A0ABN4DWE2_STRLI|nr:MULTISPECIES: MFS transporter [Streptomyces]QSJ11073.1 transmembrane efflux protein [Streptomyces lividans]AIJ15503.1 transmembrane efflux protein [Streptomyces lividans TK24]EOY48021.1 putative transport protein [Streptomyces lividans 1326]KKD11826.1 transporter [Streptomyces sp. WM6391]QTD71983.1 transmembrane efflux protein [Streptomyces lividans TK24] [Streptomyces lividans]